MATQGLSYVTNLIANALDKPTLYAKKMNLISNLITGNYMDHTKVRTIICYDVEHITRNSYQTNCIAVKNYVIKDNNELLNSTSITKRPLNTKQVVWHTLTMRETWAILLPIHARSTPVNIASIDVYFLKAIVVPVEICATARLSGFDGSYGGTTECDTKLKSMAKSVSDSMKSDKFVSRSDNIFEPAATQNHNGSRIDNTFNASTSQPTNLKQSPSPNPALKTKAFDLLYDTRRQPRAQDSLHDSETEESGRSHAYKYEDHPKKTASRLFSLFEDDDPVTRPALSQIDIHEINKLIESKPDARTLVCRLHQVFKDWNRVDKCDVISLENLRKVFRKAMIRCHPDKIPMAVDSETKEALHNLFHLLNETFSSECSPSPCA